MGGPGVFRSICGTQQAADGELPAAGSLFGAIGSERIRRPVASKIAFPISRVVDAIHRRLHRARAARAGAQISQYRMKRF